ncbi:hypothetical protein [Pseudomonas marginalis]|uniref:hypothetical protein n=1 Tax=Pseudomonas TaxID=286 RepID=UPI002B1CCC5F|nr:hypothetical protein [Pseudomonas marginalis]
MDIESMLNQTLGREMETRSATEREELISHFERFEQLVRDGIVQPEPYGVALAGSLAPAPAALDFADSP